MREGGREEGRIGGREGGREGGMESERRELLELGLLDNCYMQSNEKPFSNTIAVNSCFQM